MICKLLFKKLACTRLCVMKVFCIQISKVHNSHIHTHLYEQVSKSIFISFSVVPCVAVAIMDPILVVIVIMMVMATQLHANLVSVD